MPYIDHPPNISGHKCTPIPHPHATPMFVHARHQELFRVCICRKFIQLSYIKHVVYGVGPGHYHEWGQSSVMLL